MKLLIFTLISLPLAAAACADGADGSGVCLTYFVPSITVFVRDSVTGAGAAPAARLVVREGSYSDSMTVPANSPDSTAITWEQDRAGTYTVIVRKAGYKDWSQLNVRVLEVDVCHGRHVDLAARLQPI